jgi:hypothetical protein
VRGLLLSQDEYTVHVLDLREQIRSYPRTDLKDVAFPKESIMPSFARLGESGINDLLAYLCGGKR